MRLTLLWLLLFGFVCSCAAKKKVSFPDEKFTAEQIYERRDELLKKVIRAEFYWWWGSGQCHVLVTGGDGTTRRLPVIYDGGKIPETNPMEWAKFQLVQHVHDENWEAKLVKRSRKDLPLKFCLRIDADVEVIPPDPRHCEFTSLVGPGLRTGLECPRHANRPSGDRVLPKASCLLQVCLTSFRLQFSNQNVRFAVRYWGGGRVVYRA